MFVAEGTLIDGKYEVISSLGAGGMGVVYEVHQLGLDRIVALKLLTGLPNESQEEVLRFEREALILSKLSHLNIVQFYAYGSWSGLPFITMERLAGDSLQKLLVKNEPLPINTTVDYARQICDGLEHAHNHGIVHRDIKPTNVIICSGPGGRSLLKIIDFGLAKLSGVGIQQLTQANAAIGSVLYMSPEQCTGKPADSRSDVYSLGCLLYHCLTGEPPFVADNAVAVMFQQINDAIENTSGWHLLPVALQPVVARCLAKDPAARYQSCGELREHLLQAAQSESGAIGVRPSSNRIKVSAGSHNFGTRGQNKSPKSVIVITLATTAGLLVAGIGGYLFIHHSLRGEPSQAISAFGAPEDIIMDLIQRDKRSLAAGLGPVNLSSVEAERIAEAIERCRVDPSVNADALLHVYALLDRYYAVTGEGDKRRASLVVALEARPGARDSFHYSWLLFCARGLSGRAAPDITLLRHAEDFRQRFPHAADFEKYGVDLGLADDYAKFGRYREARALFLSLKETVKFPQQQEAATKGLTLVDAKIEALAQIAKLSKQLDKEIRTKQATCKTALKLVQSYRTLERYPGELVFQQLVNPVNAANSPAELLTLRSELGRSLRDKGDYKKSEEIWKGLLGKARADWSWQKNEREMSDYYQGVLGLCRIYLETGRYRDCIAVTEQYWFDYPLSGGAFWVAPLTVNRAHAYRHLNSAQIAEPLYRQVIADCTGELGRDKNFAHNHRLVNDWLVNHWLVYRAEAYIGLACSLYSRGQYEEALAVSNSALKDAIELDDGLMVRGCKLLRRDCAEKINHGQDRELLSSDTVQVDSQVISRLSYLFEPVVPVSAICRK